MAYIWNGYEIKYLIAKAKMEYVFSRSQVCYLIFIYDIAKLTLKDLFYEIKYHSNEKK